MSSAILQPPCPVKPTNLPRPKPVSVNGVAIPRAEIAREVQNHPAGKPIEAWLAAARALVVRELLLQEARRLAIVPAPLSDGDGRRETDEEAIVRQLVEQEVVTPAPDDATCRRVYEANPQRFRTSDLCEVRHILLAADPRDRAARRQAREVADAVLAELASDPARFAALAAVHSACPSKSVGGNLGQISRGQTVPEFEAALALCPVGRVHDEPIETRYGFHVVMVEHRIEGRRLPFEIVRDGIAEWLVERVRRTATRQYIGMLAGRAMITGLSLDASASPLVQ